MFLMNTIKCLKYEAKNLAKSDFLEFKDFLKNNSL